MRRSSIDSKEKHGAGGAGAGGGGGRRIRSNANIASRIEESSHGGGRSGANNTQQPQQQQQQQQQQMSQKFAYVPSPTSNFRLVIPKPQAIVTDLLGVLVCKSFMTSSKEFRDFFQHNVLEYLNDNWKQKQLKIMINFFRCSQLNVPDEYKLADREEPKEEQIKAAKRHVVWKLRYDPTNSALSLFMLGITEWGYRTKALTTSIYDDVPNVLRLWKEQKIPCYVGVGSADFLLMVLTNTNFGNIVPFLNGHMNIMDFDGTKANKDFKKLVAILRVPPERILYLTRFRQDCKKAIECGLQSLIVLRPDFDSHNLINQLRSRRGSATSVDATRPGRMTITDETSSPPARPLAELKKDPDMRNQLEKNISLLSIIEDHDETNVQSSQIVENDLGRFNVVLSLSEIAFK